MKQIILIILILGVLGCSPTTKDATYNFRLPPDLAHCNIIVMDENVVAGDRIYLIKCPPGTVPNGYIGTTNSQSAGKSRKMIGVNVVE